LARKAFTIGFPRARDAVDCDYVGIVSGNEVKDKVARTSFHPRKSEVDAPYFEEFPLTYVCTLEKVIDDPEYGFYVVAKVQHILVDEDLGPRPGLFDPEHADPLLFCPLDNTYRHVGGVVGKAFSIGLARKEK
ncbi:MAG: flavin oxidoreductase, partial [Bacilli bacterium]|nr:flavin oxidoreductase [Bacilli bacterium]